jgi:hypothetical protein
MTTFAARTVRTRRMPSRTSGSTERRSIATKPARRTKATVKNPPVWSEGQQTGGDGDRACEVEAPVRVLVLRLGDVAERGEEDPEADRDVHEEDPGP